MPLRNAPEKTSPVYLADIQGNYLIFEVGGWGITFGDPVLGNPSIKSLLPSAAQVFFVFNPHFSKLSSD